MLRVGVVDFVNSLPLFYALEKKLLPHNALFFHGMPSEINRDFHAKKLDVALISATHFLDHRLDYILLSDLGVAATKKSLGMRLFAKKTPLPLDTKTILIPPHSASSVKMLSTLGRFIWKISPTYQPYPEPVQDLVHKDTPFLSIGDECLRLYDQYPRYSSIDLAEAWYKETKMSSVFAVIATRTETFMSHPEEVIEFQRQIENSFSWSQKNRETIVDEATKKLGCSKILLKEYFSTLEYQLTPQHFHGLNYLNSM